MAGIGNDVDERRLIVLFCYGSMVHILRQQMTGLDGTHVQSHSQAHPLTGNGTLQEYRFPVQGLIAGNDHIRQILHALISLAGIGHPGYLGKDIFANIGNQRRNSSHG